MSITFPFQTHVAVRLCGVLSAQVSNLINHSFATPATLTGRSDWRHDADGRYLFSVEVVVGDGALCIQGYVEPSCVSILALGGDEAQEVVTALSAANEEARANPDLRGT